jgi:hypothetical protein
MVHNVFSLYRFNRYFPRAVLLLLRSHWENLGGVTCLAAVVSFWKLWKRDSLDDLDGDNYRCHV